MAQFLAANDGAFAVAGQAATLTLTRSYLLTADTGSFSITGRDVGLPTAYDTDAQAWITAVEAADGEPLPTAIKDAVDAFVVGCKADSIWSAIKACCIMAGAKTLDGALVPLVGNAPTNNNFVSGDYDRVTGLAGNGSDKELNANRTVQSDAFDNYHQAVYVTTINSFGSLISYYLGAVSGSVRGLGYSFLEDPDAHVAQSNSNTAVDIGAPSTGFVGHTRSGSTATGRNGSADTALPLANTVINADAYVFSRGTSRYVNARISFYSIGEALALALLDARVTTLMSDIAAAFPSFDAGGFALTGLPVSLAFSTSYSLATDAGSFAQTGQAATLTLTRSYSLTADAGSFSITGRDAVLQLTQFYALAADVGSYALTGQPASLVFSAGGVNYNLAADSGAVLIAGRDAGLQQTRFYALAANAGTFAITGLPATTGFARAFTSSAGAFTLTGQAITLVIANAITAEGGAYVLTGNAAGTVYNGTTAYDISALAGSFTWEGNAFTVYKGFTLAADSEQFPLVGRSNLTNRQQTLVVEKGQLEISGNTGYLRAPGGRRRFALIT